MTGCEILLGHTYFKSALVAELEWCQEDRDGDGEMLWQVRVSDEVWAVIEALDAAPVQLDEVAS